MKNDNTNNTENKDVNRDEQAKKDNTGVQNKSSQLHVLDVLLEMKKEIFLDQSGTTYFSFSNEQGELKTFPVESSPFAALIQEIAYKKLAKTLKVDAIKEIQQILGIQAREQAQGAKRHLYNRVAKEGESFLYDLGNSVVKITSDGWDFVKLKEQVFKRNEQVSFCQVSPENGGSINSFFDGVNVKSKVDQLLIKLFIVTSLIPEIPHPVLVIHGPKGTGKSGLLKMLMRLIDPTSIFDVSMKKLDDFFLFSAARWVVGFDNVSRINLNESDVLCKLSTGGSFQKRGLYTNDSIVAMRLRNIVIMNGIPCVAERPDLLDRSLLVEMAEIDSNQRRTEAEIDAEFEKNLPKILGSAFEILSKAMKILPTVKTTGLQRMADFYLMAIAVGLAMGYRQEDIESALDENQRLRLEAATESSWLAEIIIDYLTERSIFIGTASQFLQELRGFNERENMPYASQLHRIFPKTLMNDLKRLSDVLTSNGIHFERNPRSNERTFTIQMDDAMRAKRRSKSDSIDGKVGTDGKRENKDSSKPSLADATDRYVEEFSFDGPDEWGAQ